MLETSLHLFKDGKRYRRIMQGFQRVFAATLSLEPTTNPRVNWSSTGPGSIFLTTFTFGFTRVKQSQLLPPKRKRRRSSDAFYEEINGHRIPVEREVVALLANAPGVLDLYVWLVWKTWSLNAHSVRIPLFNPGGLAEQLGSIEYSADRFFRRKLSHWLGR